MKRILKSLLQGVLSTVAIVLGMIVLFLAVDLCLERGIEYLLGGMILLVLIGTTFAFYFDNEEEDNG